MKLETRFLGTIDYEEDEIINFPAGLPSFEHEHKFLFLPIDGSDESLLCMQSVTTPHLSFVAMNPFALSPGYSPKLQPDDLKLLQVSRNEDLCYYVLCAIKKPVASSTINLKCPIAINPDIRTGCQVILEDDAYHMHHPLTEFSQNKEGGSC